MDAVAAPAVGSEATAGTNPLELFASDVSAHNLRRYQPMVVVTLAVATGIVWDRYGPSHIFAGADDSISGSFLFLLWWFACAFCLLTWFLARRRRHDGQAAWLLLVAAALAGSAWHELNWFLYDAHEIGRYAAFEPAPTCIEAIALESPERVSAPPQTPLRAIPVGERSRLPIELTGVRDGAQWRPASGFCQLSVEGHLLGIHQGDRLRVFGQLARTTPQMNPGEFNFAAHARADRRLVRVRSTTPESVATIEPGGVWNFSHVLDVMRSRAKQRVRSLIGPKHAGLAAAILLGSREGLPYAATESYLVTGTVHVPAVYGLPGTVFRFAAIPDMCSQAGRTDRHQKAKVSIDNIDVGLVG